MPNITIKGIPADVLEKLKEQADQNKRSLNKELIFILEQQCQVTKYQAEEIEKRVDKVRSYFKGGLSAKIIKQAIKTGRE